MSSVISDGLNIHSFVAPKLCNSYTLVIIHIVQFIMTKVARVANFITISNHSSHNQFLDSIHVVALWFWKRFGTKCMNDVLKTETYSILCSVFNVYDLFERKGINATVDISNHTG